MSRNFLFIGTAVVYLAALAIFGPAFLSVLSVPAAVALFWVFWAGVTVATLVVVAVWIVTYFLAGGKASRLGLKDERDRLVESRATLLGFLWMTLVVFGAMSVFTMGHTLLGVKIAGGGLVLAFALVHAVSVFDIVRSFLASRGEA
jgi:hypothetical protein